MTTLAQAPPVEQGGQGGDLLEPVRRRSLRMLRPSRTPAGVLVALTLSAGLSLVAVESAGLLMGSPPFNVGRIAKTLTDFLARPWSDMTVQVCALGLMASGIVLLVLALVPGRPRLVPLETGDPLMVIGLTRAGLRRTLRRVAQDVPGVERAQVRLGSRYIEVTVVTDAERTGHLLRQVGAAVGDRLAGLGAMCAGEVIVRLRRKRV
jgi:hypothetical protein